MARAEFLGFVRDPSRQRPLSLPPYENRVDETCGLASPRVLKKQSPVRVPPLDIRGTVDSERGIYPSPRERRDQRKLKRTSEIVKTQAIAPHLFEPRPPSNPHKSKPHPPRSARNLTNYLDAPNKLTRKSHNYPVPSGWYQSNNVGSPAMAPAGSYNTSYYVQEPHISYPESPGELQRQFAISQRLQRKCQLGSPNPVEMGAYLGGLERSHDGDGWVDGFRLEVEKPLQRVYAQRLQPGSRCGFVVPEKPKKVRFAPVVECVEF